jgi:hypothetical protein
MGKGSEDELRGILDEAAQEIARLYENPSSWQTWLVYLLGRLEAQSADSAAHTDAYKEMLLTLQDKLRNRQRTGGW